MSTWSAGYVSDIDYIYGYYTELNPLRIKMAFLNKGLVFPEIGAACELGFGQGLSTNVHAAASVTQWYGTDFNPAQASFAQELSAASGSGAKLYDEAFADFAERKDLPDFDYIGLHGIWSWISDDNRAIIVEFIRKKLKVGGVLYISYNTLPGWAAFAPMRHLMAEHAEIIGSEGRGIISRIDDAINFADKLCQINPLFSRANPLVGERIKKLLTQNRHYLAHEYFNRDWHPMHFSTMAKWLERAKVSYACSAHYLDAIDGINMSADQQAFLKDIPDEIFRESVRDFMVNQQFRRDYWVKGARAMSSVERVESIRAQKVILATYRSDVSLKITGALGEATMSEEIYGPYLDLLADYKIKTLSQIEQTLAKKGISLSKIIEATMVLSSVGTIAFAQEDQVIQKAKEQTKKLNFHICSRSRGSYDIQYLASPVTGGGVVVSRFQQLFLLALNTGLKHPSEWADYVWSIIRSQGQQLIKEGKNLTSPEENLAELNEMAKHFEQTQLPVLEGLQIA